jgi:hypothetical protein
MDPILVYNNQIRFEGFFWHLNGWFFQYLGFFLAGSGRRYEVSDGIVPIDDHVFHMSALSEDVG